MMCFYNLKAVLVCVMNQKETSIIFGECENTPLSHSYVLRGLINNQ